MSIKTLPVSKWSSPQAPKRACRMRAVRFESFKREAWKQWRCRVTGLAPNTDYDFFVIQVPKAPFGVAWYQGDITTDKNGNGHLRVVGIFSVETFAVAAGSAPAPVVFDGPFPDARLNPAFNPIQMYHLGLWFDSPAAAQAARCPASVTPFNGEHSAGLQVLNTSNFPDDHGPLRDVTPAAPKQKD